MVDANELEEKYFQLRRSPRLEFIEIVMDLINLGAIQNYLYLDLIKRSYYNFGQIYACNYNSAQNITPERFLVIVSGWVWVSSLAQIVFNHLVFLFFIEECQIWLPKVFDGDSYV